MPTMPAPITVTLPPSLMPQAASRRRSDRVDEAAGVCDLAQMVVGITENRVDHGDALEVVADLVLHGHADAAMELDRLLPHDAARPPDLHLGGRDGAAALGGVLGLGD